MYKICPWQEEIIMISFREKLNIKKKLNHSYGKVDGFIGEKMVTNYIV